MWSNLHGAVLLGVAVAGTYLLFGRLRIRPLETVLVGVATLAALLVTPVGLRTVPYYLGVFENEAAKRATGLWARPSLSNPFDVMMILAAVVLLAAIVRRPPRLWECVALAGLAVGTLMAARHGVWLLMAAAAPAAVALTQDATGRRWLHRSPGAGGRHDRGRVRAVPRPDPAARRRRARRGSRAGARPSQARSATAWCWRPNHWPSRWPSRA